MTATGKLTDPVYQAQAILAVRDHSIAEMTRKLQRKGFTPTDITTALNWLKANKLINDEHFARHYIESITAAKPVGPYWLKNKLRQKGVSTEIIAAALAEIYSKDRERDLAARAANQWRVAHRTTSTDPQSLYRFLVSRGFSQDVIREQKLAAIEE